MYQFNSNEKIIKHVTMPEYEIYLILGTSGKYFIAYTIEGQSFEGDEIAEYEMATILFDFKLDQLEAVSNLSPKH